MTTQHAIAERRRARFRRRATELFTRAVIVVGSSAWVGCANAGEGCGNLGRWARTSARADGVLSRAPALDEREDYGDRIEETYFFGELDRGTGVFDWVRVPFVGEMGNVVLRAEGDHVLVRGFVDPDRASTVTVGDEVFNTPRATLLTRYRR